MEVYTCLIYIPIPRLATLAFVAVVDTCINIYLFPWYQSTWYNVFITKICIKKSWNKNQTSLSDFLTQIVFDCRILDVQ